jgi:membrane-bound lytic murein transglycosylase B
MRWLLAPFRGIRRLIGWPGWRGPATRLTLTTVVAAAVLAAVGAVGGYLVPSLASQAQSQGAPNSPAPTATSDGGVPGGVPVSPAPTPTTSPTPGASATPGTTGPATLRTWATTMQQRLDISVVAMQAYGYAELVTAKTTPACNLHWPTLAGIGKIESNHGTHGSSQLLDNGEAVPPIYGPALNGTNDNKLIRDTDGGKLDGDTVYDRAVGPMQFLPQTWERWGTDADGDGTADPQNINDAALSAARYLCADGHDLSTGAGWWAAIHSYNDLDKYATDVYQAANAYGLASGG